MFGLLGSPGEYVLGAHSVTSAPGAADTFGICFGGMEGLPTTLTILMAR